MSVQRAFPFEYFSGPIPLHPPGYTNIYAVLEVANVGDSDEVVRALGFRRSSSGSEQVFDSDVVSDPQSGQVGGDVPARAAWRYVWFPDSQDDRQHWVQINTTSANLVPCLEVVGNDIGT